jgi:hypothetical protein
MMLIIIIDATDEKNNPKKLHVAHCVEVFEEGSKLLDERTRESDQPR